MLKSRTIDFIVLTSLVILASALVVFFQVRFLVSAFIYLIPPILYLIIRKTQNINLILAGVLFIGILLGSCFDFLATLNKAWIIPQDQLFFKYRILGAAPIDEIIYLVLWTFLILIVYEHFFERKHTERFHVRQYFFFGILPVLIGLVTIVIVFFTNLQLITFTYAYAILGAIALAPPVYLCIKEPSLFKKILGVLPYFSFLFFSIELTALYIGQWSFPGQYLGYIEIFQFRFPLEELFMWIICSSLITVVDYKLFVDVER